MKALLIYCCITILCCNTTSAQRIGRTVIPPIIYTLDSDANLLWYKHTGYKTGSFSWANDIGARVAEGWAGFTHLFYDGSGHIYAIRANGDLLWYDHTGYVNGNFTWGAGSGTVIGRGWNDINYKGVFAGGLGVIYVVKKNGDLLWYRHLGFQDGSAAWHPNSGANVGHGWAGFYDVFSGGRGVIYLVSANGDLLWYKHTGCLTGDNTWLGGNRTKVDHGWNSFSQIFSTGQGNIYGLTDNGMLRYYNHTGYDNGSAAWGPGTHNQVGAGWSGVYLFGLGSIGRRSTRLLMQ